MDAVLSHAREQIEKGSKSFAVAARMFPPPQRAGACLLYAWCRHCDDEIDGQTLGFFDGASESGSASLRLETLFAETRAALDGKASAPVFLGLQRVLNEHSISPDHPLDLLRGMAMDARGHSYETIDDTLTYAYHVAGVVGLMMGRVMGVRDRATLERACDLGIAFQLTNIARDVVADASMGRIYLPAQWLHAAGLSAATLAAPDKRRALLGVVTRLLAVADDYYDSADEGIARLPFRCAWAVAAASRIYRRIGAVLLSQGVNAWDARAHVSLPARLSHFALGGVQAALPRWRSPPRRAGLWTPSNVGIG